MQLFRNLLNFTNILGLKEKMSLTTRWVIPEYDEFKKSKFRIKLSDQLTFKESC